jgi:hypothetical protein
MKIAGKKGHGQPRLADESQNTPAQTIFAALFGCLLGLALLKFGNPGIMEKYVTWPANIYEWLLAAWPIVIGYWLLAVVTILRNGRRTLRWF